MRPVCVKCKKEMTIEENDVMVWHPIQSSESKDGIVRSSEGSELVDFVVFGDRWKCIKCENEIITGFGNMILMDNLHEDTYKRDIEEPGTLRILR